MIVNCEHCGRPIESVAASGVGQYVSGWASNRDQGGTNALAQMQRYPRWVHRHCLKLIRDGIAAEQTTLL